MAGTGKLEHDDEAEDAGNQQRRDLGHPGQRLCVADVHLAMVGEEGKAVAEEGKASSIAKRIQSVMQLVQRFVAKDTVVGVASVSEDTRASRYHRVNCSARRSSQKNSTAAPPAGAGVKGEMYRRNWMTAYKAWKKGLVEAKNDEGVSLAPYAEQWRFMDVVHRRCVLEALEEQKGCINRTAEEPERVLGHGLPGSGKTQIMKWLAQYFQKVWGWTHGTQYVFLAPLLTMAARINGFPSILGVRSSGVRTAPREACRCKQAMQMARA